MDARMESLSAWTRAKTAESRKAPSPKGLPKDTMKQWVAAKSQASSRDSTAAETQVRLTL